MIIETTLLNNEQKQAVYRLWNQEYPENLCYDSIDDFDLYLDKLTGQHHYLLIGSNNHIEGWAFSFVRGYAKWFAIILDQAIQRQGKGSLLLNCLKEHEPVLHGWVTDRNNEVKRNGELYRSPLAFYEKNGFMVLPEIRLELDKLSAVKIVWKKEG